MTELPTENMYRGVPEAREGAIERIQNSLSFAISQGGAFAGFVVGPQRVGKTTAVLAVERGLRETLGLVASYEAVATTDPNLVYVKAAPGLDLGACPTQFWSEIPI
ncbi:hypothetical protein CO051_02490 [Candidatus Roizmanbacteria bacterium CG_4_9_14_0_2_um_filter_39_13]|uniref:Uncharacterized protein n=2 Tax=Candidatus Roizmaniibacteriota TaxID=1752723 RepID=A0A2M8F0J9_9BACT|nr:MAG: hypothetical protein COY15_03585 [Candidatus Roizmanbacteria bacterium CG_4_10_14_0_2_um_filter_39_12]PJC32822.1 MAG: hypothetical protein CO051_02490 [Candidatus Roizmanbacteria bacterium CG_4_9_14_0_2_um_filter_39_13]PJE61453.1 MAG: hypothetical protein COU87_04605 [Candidatus Roizmanbacteria bacterium CG10_big_fil_rev_8_21_14_0_10_39_12]